MKIILIQPKAWKDSPGYVFEPLGLGYLASYLKLKGYKNISVKLSAFDSEDDIVEDAAGADLVGITATSSMMTHGKQLARKIKEKNKNTVIVFGGVHPTSCPETTIEDANIDIVCRGESEETLYEIAVAVEHNKPYAGIDGISYKNNEGEIIHNKARTPVHNLDSLPYPDRALIRQSKFSDIFWKSYGRRSAFVFGGRGCPYKCSYCATDSVWGRHVRLRSPENIMGEIGALVKTYGINYINFADDTFTIDKQHVFGLCELLKKKKLPIGWGCNVHPRTTDKQLFQEMKGAGCTEIWAGVESGSQGILDELKRNYTLEEVKELFAFAKETGLKRQAYIMAGTPGESKETLKQTEEFLDQIKPDIVILSLFVPIPGSELYIKARDKGYVKDDMDWSDIKLIHANLPGTRFLSRDALLNETTALYKRTQKYMRRGRFNILKMAKSVPGKLKRTTIKGYPKLIIELLDYIKRPV
jgi:radical SAM superfamily enzyme YgiQ (UPF0313 family)